MPNRSKSKIRKVKFLIIAFLIICLLITLYTASQRQNIFSSASLRNCKSITSEAECLKRGCMDNHWRCYWNIRKNECKKMTDITCVNLSQDSPENDSEGCSLTCPSKSCDDTRAEQEANNARCAKVFINNAIYCSSFRRHYCCPQGKVWTHYDKSCCDPGDVYYVWNEKYPPNEGVNGPEGGKWDPVCGCPKGKYCVQ